MIAMRLFSVIRSTSFSLSMFSCSICLPFYLHVSSSCFRAADARNWDPAASLTLNHPTLVLLEKNCKTRHHFKQILAQMIRLHLASRTFPMSRLLYFSAISHPEHLLNYAILLFRHFTPNPNLFILNTMILALSFSITQSVTIYNLMLSLQICPDEHSLLPLLKSCDCFSVGQQIHSHVIVNGLSSNVYMQNSLMKVYMDSGKTEFAHQVFDQMSLKDLVSYNIMVSGCAKNGFILEGFELLNCMIQEGIDFDEYSMVGILQLCGRLKNVILGKSINAWVMRRKFLLPKSSLVLGNALMDMYVKCEEIGFALKVFEGLEKRSQISWNIIISGFANAGEFDAAYRYFNMTPLKDLASWNSLLAGFAQHGDWGAVTNIFKEMAAQDIKPDKITSFNLISAASETGVLDQGRCVHGLVLKAHGSSDEFLGSALIDMYCKCGSTESSLRVFQMIGGKDVTTWTAMLAGLAFHGRGIEALELFRRLKEEGLMPNYVTLIAVLTGCSHSGLVDQGLKIFSSMREEYGVEPGVEHYGCIVDLLARSGKLIEARDLIRRMKIKPSKSMWGAILSASRAHGDLKLGNEALKELVQLNPEEDGGYILLSNAYASCGRWSYSNKVREIMGRRGIKKNAGWSSVEVNGVLHAFVSWDKRLSNLEDIRNVLLELHKEMEIIAGTL
ncbi:Pentatricopeptide repeat-containing protein [Apostasia shenzhenica]|uniref:Pentatricopeptide repeat-containing protein n=1 Tax=Apostasia shenzhenica TaxID=1088818 RepID=A0A2I0B0T9_9ASPA|nr:Pentatricopeptide repeat-containing protein [Apostasia shenzhenica]